MELLADTLALTIKRSIASPVFSVTILSIGSTLLSRRLSDSVAVVFEVVLPASASPSAIQDDLAAATSDSAKFTQLLADTMAEVFEEKAAANPEVFNEALEAEVGAIAADIEVLEVTVLEEECAAALACAVCVAVGCNYQAGACTEACMLGDATCAEEMGECPGDDGDDDLVLEGGEGGASLESVVSCGLIGFVAAVMMSL